ncbi:TraK domain-containing protein [Rhodanobacter sp. FW106-PBR-LB-2-11]|uniref:TraK domain-containing protein n=1 Tax=Rhodanobacter sp. FW106-PBR-LB-2-11 TaxID=1524463 RepID=UPI0034E543ED
MTSALLFVACAAGAQTLPTAPANSAAGQRVERQVREQGLPMTAAPSAPQGIPRPAQPVTPPVTAAPNYAVQSGGAPRQPRATTPYESTTYSRQVAEPRARDNIKAPPPVVHVRAGINVLFGVAQDHLNRIITPFKKPVIETTSTATTSVKGNVVYVAPDSDAPIGFFIHDAGDQENAISVTMVPAAIPPISVTLDLVGYVPSKDQEVVEVQGNTGVAKGWETDQPFTDTVKSLFKTIADGRVPDGFTFSQINGATPLMPRCAMGSLRIEPKQVMTGFNIDAVVALVTNLSPIEQDINETGCKGASVLAVAAWPRTKLGPGQSTELYIAVQAPPADPTDAPRPSLVSGVR